jgi:D-3-phosphoglycerate dehydrogenase
MNNKVCKQPIVFVTDDRYSSYQEEEAVLSSVDARLTVLNLSCEEEAVVALREADGILVNLFPLNARVIDSLDHCRIISRYGVGYDNVDLEAATRKGIWVARVPDYATEDVSDHALALLLGCVRKIAYKDHRIRSGAWNMQKEQPVFRVAGKTLGLVGFGSIARALHRKIGGFGLGKILVYDPYVPADVIKKEGCVPVTLEFLLTESDYVSLHIPLSSQTRGLIGQTQIGMMKTSGILINTARGPVVDEVALCRALQTGKLAGAGLDVFEKEPLPDDSPLRKLDNVILSDHNAWYSEESMVELKTKAALNVARVLAGNPPVYPVNFIAQGGDSHA